MIDYILLALSLLGTWGSLSLMRGKMITKIILLFFLWITLIMTLGFGVAHYFTGEGTNEAFFYHVFVGVDGTAYTGLGGVFFVITIAVICGIWLSIFLIKRKSDKRIKIWGYLLACISIFLHPFCQGYLDYRGINPLTNIGILGSDFSQHFVSLDKENISLGNGKNIIYIYLESLENNYLDEEIFPGLTPYLNELRKNAVNFSRVEQLVGTGFTMAGKVASQCGIPLITPGGGNSMGGMDTYLPGATCIGDILKHVGYTMTYSGGASLVFGGKGDFYRSHGFDVVRGKEEFEGYNRLTHNDWGLYDEDLFDIILPEIIEKHNSGKPFGYFTITVDTHNPHGFISKKCTKRYTKQESILNAVHCSDELVGRFVEKLEKAGVLENTVLVIGSDHLAMPNDATEKLNTKQRYDSLMILDGDRAMTIDRAASTMDIGPTILYLLGIEVDGLGFGRNLFDTAPTLNEKFENPREALRWKRELKEFWSFPNLEGTIHIKTEQEKISIDGREIDFPVLMHLGRKTRVENMWFQFDSPEKLGQFYQELDESAKIFWVDTCDALREKIPNTPNMKYCLAEGTKKNISVVGLSQDHQIQK